MKALAIERTSAAKAGWVIGALFVAWMIFLFMPRREGPPEAKPVMARLPPSRLIAFGLPDDPDLEGLPGFFAVWADHAEWKDGKTRFAFRHPATGRFSYFFEATKAADGYRFRKIPEPVDPAGSLVLGDELDEGCPIRFYVTDTESVGIPTVRYDYPVRSNSRPSAGKMSVDLPAAPVKLETPDVSSGLKPSTEEKKPNR